MWGVGCVPFKRALQNFGFDQQKVFYFEDQCKPDPKFGGEKRPNPEERHNMERMFTQAADGVQVILANDPDADRLALAERVDGKWRAFHGNEIGAILCEWQIENSSGPDRLVLSSTVSSQILKKMAKHHGIHFEETLTGFKWLATASRSHPELKTVFAFEEAIGYSAGTDHLLVGDKDGVSTACLLLEMANILYKRGETITKYLDGIYKKYGYHAWQNVGISVKSMKDVPGLFKGLVGDLNNRKYCQQIGRFKVNRVRDMKAPGYDSELGKPNLPVAETEMLTFYTDEVLLSLIHI